MIIETVFLNLLFMIPGFFLIELFDIDVKGKYLLTPYLSFGYFNFLSILLFLFNFKEINYWFYLLSLLPLILFFKLKFNLKLLNNFIGVSIFFIFLDLVLSFFTLISLPGNTNNTFDEIYKLFNYGTENLNIGFIPLPMFTSGIFTNLDFSKSLINIFFIQFIFISLFSILNIVKNVKHAVITILFLISNFAIFEVTYELLSYRSHSLTASSLMILFIYFHKKLNLKTQKILIFFAVFLLINSRLENILFGYLYLFSFYLLNSEKFISNKKIILASSTLAGVYMAIIPRSSAEEDLRSSDIFILLLVLFGFLLIYYEFFNTKIIYYLSFIFSYLYVIYSYIIYREIFISVVAVTYTKIFDPNSGYGLQFIFFIVLYIYVTLQSNSVSHQFSKYMLFILYLNFLIGILQTYIYQGQASLEYIENMSIFNPLDLSTFRGSVQTISFLWLVGASAFIEENID